MVVVGQRKSQQKRKMSARTALEQMQHRMHNKHGNNHGTLLLTIPQQPNQQQC
jgi:hypothetical protein